MTPFSQAFRAYRKRNGLRQKQVAYALGVSLSYVSSWETALKPPPSGEVLGQLSSLFQLDRTEAADFRRAAGVSRPLLRVPKNTSSPGYILAHQLVDKLPRLCPRQIDLISAILELNIREAPMTP